MCMCTGTFWEINSNSLIFFLCVCPFSNLSLFAQSLISHYILFHLLDICFSAAYSLLVQPNAAMCIHCGGQEGRPGMETRACCSHPKLSNLHRWLVQGLSGNSVLLHFSRNMATILGAYIFFSWRKQTEEVKF